MSEPLMAPLDAAQATPQQAQLLAEIPPLAIARMIAHAPELASSMIRLGRDVMSTESVGLPDDLREALIIRAGRVRGSDYVEAQHRRIAHLVGLSPSVIDAAAEGAGASSLPDEWRPVMRMVEAGLAGVAARQRDVDMALQFYGAKGVVGALVTAGFFGVFATVACALSIPPDVPDD